MVKVATVMSLNGDLAALQVLVCIVPWLRSLYMHVVVVGMCGHWSRMMRLGYMQVSLFVIPNTLIALEDDHPKM